MHGRAALAACGCVCLRPARGPPTEHNRGVPRACVRVAEPGCSDVLAHRGGEATETDCTAEKEGFATRVSGDNLDRRRVPPPSHETWVARVARLRRQSGSAVRTAAVS